MNLSQMPLSGKFLFSPVMILLIEVIDKIAYLKLFEIDLIKDKLHTIKGFKEKLDFTNGVGFVFFLLAGLVVIILLLLILKAIFKKFDRLK